MSKRAICLIILLALGWSGTALAQAPLPFTLTTSPNPSNLGDSVLLSVSNPPCIYAATVTFFSDGVVIGTSPMDPSTGNVPPISFSGFEVGSHSVYAQYGNICAETVPIPPITSTVVTQVVLDTTSTTLSIFPNPATTCQLVTLTATVTPSAPPPPPSTPAALAPRAVAAAAASLSGVVTFLDGGAILGSAPVNSSGIATLTVGPLSAGSHSITANYRADPFYRPSTSTPVTLTVTPAAPTTVAVSFDVNPAVFNQAVSVTATVSPSTAVGNVTFFEGTTSLGSAPISGGKATLRLPVLPVGSHTITATFGGVSSSDTCLGGSSGSAVLVINRAPSTTMLTCGPSPSVLGQPVNLLATVGPSGLTGTVSFRDGTNPIGSAVTLNNGSASTSVSTLSPGSHQLFADYSGNTNYLPSTGSCTQVVLTPTTTTLSSSPNPSAQGQPVTLTANVAPAGATGNVTFRDGGAAIGSAPLINGVAVFSTSALSVGQHALTAVYGGDSSFAGSTSNTVLQIVGFPTPPAPTVFLTITPNPAEFGQNVVMTAAVTPASATGTITFFDGTTPLATVPLANGTATFSIATLALGVHNITAAYSGDSTNSAATSNVVLLTVNRRTVTLALSAAPNPAAVGQTVTLTAKVSPSAGVTGTVTFLDGGNQLGTASVNGGTATFTTSGLTAGAHALTAVYNGDTNNNSATSNTVNLTVLATTRLTLNASPTTAAPGQSVALTATVAPTAATGTVTFSEGGNTLGTANLSGGTATISVTLPIGNHTITATYGGDTVFAGSTSNSVTVSVGLVVTITTLSSTPNPSAVGQTVTLTANVTVAGPFSAGGAPTGSVTFSDAGTNLGSANLSGGTATFSVSSLTLGSHPLTATYSGDNTFATSTSSTVTQVVSNNPLQITAPPQTLPDATVGASYSQQITVSGGTQPYTFSSPDASNGLSVSASGLLSGTPQNAGNINVTVQVRDSSTPQQTLQMVFNLTTNFPTLPPISINVTTQPASVTDQPAPQFQLSQAYPLALTAVVTLSFSPNASNLPANFDITQNPAIKFPNGQISTTVNIPANSTAPIALPAISIGHIAGTIRAQLTSLFNSATNQPIPLPAQTIAAQITVPRLPPVITPGSVRIQNITATGLEVFLDGTSTTRELISANITFTAASGTTLTGTTTFNNIPLTTPSNTFFASAQGLASGGDFSLVIPFTFSGNTSAIGTVSVTLTNAAGTSGAASGGR